MNPLGFVGTPDWRSLPLALAFVAPWLILVARRWLGRFETWLALTAAAALFPLSIAWVQVPIQQLLNALYASLLPAEAISRYALLLGAPVIAVSGLVQEVVKFGIATAALRRMEEDRPARAGLALGAASGAGYGGLEAFWVFNQIFASGLTWATVQLVGPVALLGFVERFFSVMFHIGATSLSTYGAATGRAWRYLLIAVALHSVSNYAALLVQARALDLAGAELWIGVIGGATMAAALWLRLRARPVSHVD